MHKTSISPELLEQILSSDFQKLFWSKVKITEPDGCWIWQASLGTGGYGQIGLRRFGIQFILRCHQVAWVSQNKMLVPSGLWILHSCIGTRTCCNPAHLRAGTRLENIQDMDRQGRRDNRKGERSATVKTNTADVIKMREDYKTGMFTQQEIATKYGIGKTRAGEIVTGKAWTHIKPVDASPSAGQSPVT